MTYLADVIRDLAPGLVPDSFVGGDEWEDRLYALRSHRGLSLDVAQLLYDGQSVPMLERVEAMTPEQIVELNEAAA